MRAGPHRRIRLDATHVTVGPPPSFCRTMLEVIVSIDHLVRAEIESRELITVVLCGICSQRLEGKAGAHAASTIPWKGNTPQIPLGISEYCVDPLRAGLRKRGVKLNTISYSLFSAVDSNHGGRQR
jgi:hypothetical protein